MTRVLPVPGVAERAVGFTSIAEAIHLRNCILSRLEAAAATHDGEARRRALTFCFVGGGYSGVEALAELQDMAVDACRMIGELSPSDMRFVLVEATGRILPTLGDDLASLALGVLRARGVEVRLETQLESAEDGVMRLSDGTVFRADTLVWSAGVVPHTLVAELGLPADDRGRLRVDPFLRVTGAEGAWAAGDCAAVPDLVTGGTCPPTAQHAVREGRRLGENLAAVVSGGSPAPFRYESRGEFVTLGMRKGLAEIRGRPLTGFLPWFLRRAYYCTQVPTANRKLRALADWAVGMPFRHDVVNLGSVQEPRAALEEAAGRR